MTDEGTVSLPNPPHKPPHPLAVLAAAIVLPGTGHLWLGLATRALTFIFFIIVFGWLTTRFAKPDVSFVGRHAGGFFVYALSIMDAYRIARRRFEVWRRQQPGD